MEAEPRAARGRSEPHDPGRVDARALGRVRRDQPGPLLRCGRAPLARPGNRFWKALYGAGFTERVWSPFQDRDLPTIGLGITNLVDRTTASAGELAADELRTGRARLERKVARHRPRIVAILGITAYRTGFDRPAAVLGRQPVDLGGVPAWVLPNPSGLNAHHQIDDLVRRFSELRAAASRRPRA